VIKLIKKDENKESKKSSQKELISDRLKYYILTSSLSIIGLLIFICFIYTSKIVQLNNLLVLSQVFNPIIISLIFSYNEIPIWYTIIPLWLFITTIILSILNQEEWAYRVLISGLCVFSVFISYIIIFFFPVA